MATLLNYVKSCLFVLFEAVCRVDICMKLIIAICLQNIHNSILISNSFCEDSNLRNIHNDMLDRLPNFCVEFFCVKSSDKLLNIF